MGGQQPQCSRSNRCQCAAAQRGTCCLWRRQLPRPEAAGTIGKVSLRLGKRRRLNGCIEHDFVAERVEKLEAIIRATFEQTVRVIKRQFGFTNMRYRRLAKNTAQVVTLFALIRHVDGAMAVDGCPGGSAHPSPNSSAQDRCDDCTAQRIETTTAQLG